jgi:phytoene dehydrogenase-like protein
MLNVNGDIRRFDKVLCTADFPYVAQNLMPVHSPLKNYSATYGKSAVHSTLSKRRISPLTRRSSARLNLGSIMIDHGVKVELNADVQEIIIDPKFKRADDLRVNGDIRRFT